MKNLVKTGTLALAAVALVVACSPKPAPEPPPPPPTTPTPTVVTLEPTPAPTPKPTPRSAEEDIKAMSLDRVSSYLKPVFFDYDKADLRGDARDVLAANAAWLKSHPTILFTIEGHCDERGTAQYNLALGDRRANSAKEYLVSLGIDAGRVKSVSYGKERPFATGHDEDSWAKNRRGHFVVTAK
ncbi:MAG: peptidoglycan-associated lipoprotein Pal [Acidobacteria bacterium]|nr:peptidoglycan-associated lipoprotein Pal [Acidobacteriota bacterium]